MNKKSFLLITLDSCRYDVFLSAKTPNMNNVGDTHKAISPSFFTLPSHISFFAGFTPAVHGGGKWLNPKGGKIWRVRTTNISVNKNDYCMVHGKNVIEGMNNKGYHTIGTGAVRWFCPNVPTGKILTEDFQNFKWFGEYTQAEKQIEFILKESKKTEKSTFSFINFGETHDPYRYKGCDFPKSAVYKTRGKNQNSRNVVFEQQKKCVEHIDNLLQPLLDYYLQQQSVIVITADHGELFGEDGLWQHQDNHEMTRTVPLIVNLEGNKLCYKNSKS